MIMVALFGFFRIRNFRIFGFFGPDFRPEQCPGNRELFGPNNCSAETPASVVTSARSHFGSWVFRLQVNPQPKNQNCYFQESFSARGGSRCIKPPRAEVYTADVHCLAVYIGPKNPKYFGSLWVVIINHPK